MPTFLDLSVADQAVVCSAMDMITMMTLRCCSRATRLAVASVLRHNLRTLCANFLPKPSEFVRRLHSMNSYIGGPVAVRWMLRDPSVDCSDLEVFVPADRLALMLHEVVHNQRGQVMWLRRAEDAGGELFRAHGVENLAALYTEKGLVTVYESTTEDALTPIACRQSSVEVTYVNSRYFGTVFPSLLFHRRAILADPLDTEVDYVREWVGRGFDLRLYAESWPEYRGMTCCAASWACPAQPRRFTDGGALAARMDPLRTPRLDSGLLFRLDVRPCGGECLCEDVGEGILNGEDKYADMYELW